VLAKVREMVLPRVERHGAIEAARRQYNLLNPRSGNDAFYAIISHSRSGADAGM